MEAKEKVEKPECFNKSEPGSFCNGCAWEEECDPTGSNHTPLGICVICGANYASIVWNNDKAVCEDCDSEATEEDKN